MLLRISPVMAQQAWSDLSISRPPPRPEPPRTPRRIVAPDEDTQRPNQGVTSETARVPIADPLVPRIRGAAPIEREQEDGEPERAYTMVPAGDGHIDLAEPPIDEDGKEPVVGDPRLPEDRAAFLSPPAGYDDLAFQIELDPATDRRPQRLTTLDPYAPTGRRAGSWVIFPTVEAGVTGITNVYRTSNSKPDLIFDVQPTLLAVTDWQQHAMQLKVTGVGSDYTHFSAEDQRAYAFEARGRFDISRRANIEVLAAHSYDQEPRSSLFAPADARTPTPYSTDKIAVAFNQRFNRLSLQLRGGVTDIDYKPVATYDGSGLSNDERDLSSRDVAVRAAWAFNPALALFAESALNSQRYRALSGDGISRDSTGDRSKIGLSFGTQSQIWRGEFAVGYGRQQSRDARLPNVEGMLVEANLGWKPTPITALLLKANTDFVTSTTPGQGNATTHLAGVELRHALQRQLIGVAGVSYQLTSYQGISLSERTTTSELGFEYYLSKATTLLWRYQHIVVDSSDIGGNSTTDAFRLGVRYRP